MPINKPAAITEDVAIAKIVLKNAFPKDKWKYTNEIYKLLETDDLKLFIKDQKEKNLEIENQSWILFQKTEQELCFIFNAAVAELLNKRSNLPKPM